MTIINLRDFYYWYTQDEYIEVTDDVAEALQASVRYEAAYTERVRYNKAYYYLDADDGIEYSACLHELTPDEVLELKERFCRLWNALNSLPETQGRRVDAHFILGMTYREIAKAEGVDKSAVRRSVLSGIAQTDEKIFEKKSVIAVSICSIFLVVYERKFFLLHN